MTWSDTEVLNKFLVSALFRLTKDRTFCSKLKIIRISYNLGKCQKTER